MPAGRAAVALAWRLREPRAGRDAARAPVPLRPRLPRPAPREPGLSLRRRAAAASACAGARTPACRAVVSLRRTARYAHEPELVPQLPLRRGAGARPRLRRGPRLARRAAAGIWRAGEAVWILAAERHAARRAAPASAAPQLCRRLRDAEQRAPPASRRRLHRAADAYIVRRGAARRSSPAIRGSPTGGATRSSPCAACASPPAGSTTRATSCSQWAGAVSEGMLPNRFPDHGDAPEFNSVDASLWYVVAVHEFLRRRRGARRTLTTRDQQALRDAVEAILDGYAARHALRHPLRRRRPARGRRARRAAHLDGRQGRRLGGDAAHRQAGRGAGAVAQRAAHRQRTARTAGRRVSRAGAQPSRERFWNDGARLPVRRRRRRSRARHGRRGAAAQPDLRRRRPAAARCSTASARGRSSTRSSAAADAARPALARARASPATRRTTRAACASATAPTTRAPCGRGCSARSSKPGCACAATPPSAKREARAALPRAAARPPRRRPASATSPRSPTATRRTRRAAARSRPGRSARRCASTRSCWRSDGVGFPIHSQARNQSRSDENSRAKTQRRQGEQRFRGSENVKPVSSSMRWAMSE